MVQIIGRPERREDMGDAFAKAIMGFTQQRQQENQQKLLGKLLSGDELNDNERGQIPMDYQINAYKAMQERAGQGLSDESYKVIESHFGKKAADLYKATTPGGRTSYLNQLLEDRQRASNVEDKIESYLPSEDIEVQSREPKRKYIDFDKGLTPKERIKREDSRYSQNLPLFQESQTKLHALDAERQGLDILEDLSPKVSGLDKLNVNPKSGELILPTLASPEAQRYVKTINDFTTKAKDSFGARVTNFDLTQFLKRLPTLANSEEGRAQLLQQMKIINDINKVYEQTLHGIIDDYGGIRKIDFDQAQRMAEKESKKEIESLKKKFSKIQTKSDTQFQRESEDLKKVTPKGHIAVQRADGSIGYIPQEKLKDFLKVEGNKAL